MLVSPFSCTRPEPDHVAAARAFASAAELDAAIAAGDYTCDVSRALYLVAHAANGAVTTAVACCCDLSELGGSVACGQAYEDEAQRVAAHLEALGAHDVPVTIAYPANVALSYILGAARTSTPLYNLQRAGEQLVLWRVSRPEAVEAICATFGQLEGHVVAGEEQAAAAALVADAMRERRGSLDERAPVLHPLALLVTQEELETSDGSALPLPGLLMHRFA